MEKVVAKTFTFVTTSLWSRSSPEAVFFEIVGPGVEAQSLGASACF